MNYSIVGIGSNEHKDMRSKKRVLTNFSHAIFSQSSCVRPDNEEQLADYIALNPNQSMLVRGSGLSYNDSCFNSNHFIIDSERLNHFISFDSDTGIVTCQGGVKLKDLFVLHPDFIPPVLPGTVHATVAGSIAHDVHGKNNHQAGSFGHHLLSLDLLIRDKKIRCSPEENSDLFYASIAGLGLTGVITRATIRLKKASPYVQITNQQVTSLKTLTELMVTEGISHAYQVAWLDLLNPGQRSILSTADHCEAFISKKSKPYTIPSIPFGLIKAWNMKLFNQYFFNSKKAQGKLSLEQFNNPLDKLTHWNRLYGPKGLIQFQAVFSEKHAVDTLDHLFQLIREHQATPTIAVLKFFTQPGKGLLSFCKPGFTLAVDFIHNKQAKQAIMSMNQFISETNGRIYLAKDLLLDAACYRQMYDKQKLFSQTLERYSCTLHSDLATRLGIKDKK